MNVMAGGGIGRALRETLRGAYPILRLSDRVALAPAHDGEEVDRTEIADMEAVRRMVEGVDGIVHLGGNSGEAEWPVILQSNIVGVYNVFEAARAAGVQRIVMATSNHAVGFYPRAQTIDNRVVPRPDSRYGVSKAFSEALASLYADKHGIGFLCVRIGNFGTQPIDKRRLSIWISPARSDPSCAHRARTPRGPLRNRLWRLEQPALMVRQFERLSPWLSAAGRFRALCRSGIGGRASRRRSDRRALSGRYLLRRRIHRNGASGPSDARRRASIGRQSQPGAPPATLTERGG
jgi:hypothetical protein